MIRSRGARTMTLPAPGRRLAFEGGPRAGRSPLWWLVLVAALVILAGRWAP